MSSLFRRISVLSCLLLFLAAISASAQVSTGEIFGKATDGTGSVLPGVAVTLSGKSRDNGVVHGLKNIDPARSF